MNMGSLLYDTRIEIAPKIHLRNPLIGEILDFGEKQFWSAVTSFTSTSYDYMVELYDAGIKYEDISDFQLFCMFFDQIKSMDCSILFDDVDFTRFDLAVDHQNQNIVLWNQRDDVVIDDAIFFYIASKIRTLCGLKRVWYNMGNEAARSFFIDKERRKQRRHKNKPFESILEREIIAMVNCAECKYNFETIRQCNLYQFNSSVAAIQHRVHFDKLMIGVYAGTVDIKNIDKKELTIF